MKGIKVVLYILATILPFGFVLLGVVFAMSHVRIGKGRNTLMRSLPVPCRDLFQSLFGKRIETPYLTIQPTGVILVGITGVCLMPYFLF
jgi:hypothetical protein